MTLAEGTLKNIRIQGLDFLRGIAILLVLLRHEPINMYTYHIGWMGVDLFFVLSGFLISGLIYKEYQAKADFKPVRFLIRRGFKIYPVYYLTYMAYVAVFIDQLDYMEIASDLLYFQNYLYGWGNAYPAIWSLAVEEHFYFGIALSAFIYLRWFHSNIQLQLNPKKFISLLLFICLSCLCFRISHVLSDPTEYAKNITMTHYRIDALVSGVLASYLFHFHHERFNRVIKKHRHTLVVLGLILLSWTPYLDPQTSIFVRTFGFTMVYLAFAIILCLVVTHHDVFEKVQNTILSIPYKWCCQLGIGSYAIYVIHSLVDHSYHAMLAKNLWELPPFTDFFLTTCCSVLIGFLIKHQIENRFLKIRDRLFPSNG